MRAVLADTGPLYAALDPDDDNHERAQADIERLNSEELGVMVAYPTFCESYSLVLHRLDIVAAHGWMKELRESTLPCSTPHRTTTVGPQTCCSHTRTRISVCSML